MICYQFVVLSDVDKFLCLRERVNLSHIHQFQVWLDITAEEVGVTLLEVEVDDAEPVGPLLHWSKHLTGDDVYTGESEQPQ